MAALLGDTWTQLSQNVFPSLTDLVTVPPILRTIIGPEEPLTQNTRQDIQQRISSPSMRYQSAGEKISSPSMRYQNAGNKISSPSVRYQSGDNKISADEALRRLKLAERRRRLTMRRAGSFSKQSGSEKADVVFFPTDGSDGGSGGCQDDTAGGGGFNTFSFMAFLLAGFNAISVVSNNNNNNNDNNNNNNNDNNNNNQQSLESSVMGMQNVGGRRKRDVSLEDEDQQLLNRILLVGDNFMRAWMRNKMTKSKDCHLNNICQANRLEFLAEDSSNTVEVARIFSTVATRGLVRQISPPDTHLEEEYYEAGSHGTLEGNILDFLIRIIFFQVVTEKTARSGLGVLKLRGLLKI